MHPNAEGQAAMADAILMDIREEISKNAGRRTLLGDRGEVILRVLLHEVADFQQGIFQLLRRCRLAKRDAHRMISVLAARRKRQVLV